MNNYITKSPVLFLVFNRPDTSIRVFDAIKKAKPSRLYIAADGPRANRKNEEELCKQTRALAENVDWLCEVKTLFREKNLGCKDAVSSAIDWFFENEEEGIILEDDCLPATTFFSFCDTVLEKYRDDTRIRHVAGSNHHLGKKLGNANTFFSRHTAVWGWATWRRVWNEYDKDLKNYPADEVETQLNKIFSDPFLIETLVQIFKDVKNGKINTWDYQLSFLNYFNNSLSVNPNVNLISNIGFRSDGTHTLNEQDPLANLPIVDIEDHISYPKYMLAEALADYEVLARSYNLDERWKKHNLLRRRFKRWLRRSLK